MPKVEIIYFELSVNESDIDKSAESDGYLPCDNSSTSGVNTPETHSHEDRVEDVFDELKHLRRKHPLQFMCAYLNIKSLRYTFCLIEELLTSNIVDMLFLAEAKIDETFTDTQFKVNDFHFWHADRNQYDGGLVTYARSDLACDRRMNLEYQSMSLSFIDFSKNESVYSGRVHLLQYQLSEDSDNVI
jgi:hypothetical protein